MPTSLRPAIRSLAARVERPPSSRRVVPALLGALALTAGLGACTSGAPDAGSAPATVTVTSTTTPPGAGGSSTATTDASAPATSTIAASPPSATTPPGATTGGQTSPAGPDQTASGLPTCRSPQVTVRVEAEAGGGAAGSQVLSVLATNTGPSSCVTQGFPGVSLVAPTTGTQLGAAADRVPGDGGSTGPLIRLEPGTTTVSRVQVAQAVNFSDRCGLTRAAGFRVYLPGTTTAAYAPYAIDACSSASVHQLKVKPFGE